MSIYGCIEAGGTKFVCAWGSGPEDLSPLEIIPTTQPQETLDRVFAYFHQVMDTVPLAGIGIGAFGPLDLHADSPKYGFITSTPKTSWINTNIKGIIQDKLRLPIILDTDVNAAVLGEYTWGAGLGLETLVYITVGTGIGMGGIVAGNRMHGLQHPEAGHIFIPHDRQADPFIGCCPYHGDCLEGLASGSALRQRWGQPAEELPVNHPAWAMESLYLAYLVCNIVLTISPQRIILGGGVMRQTTLLPLIRLETRHLLANYIDLPALQEGLDDYITAPGLEDRAGILGALALARLGG